MITAWRLVKARHAASAFSGEGARLYGGRWNSPGYPVVYTAGSLALAALEVLVHVKSRKELNGYVKVRVAFTEELVETVAMDALPTDWQRSRTPREIRALGDLWLEEGRTAVPCLRGEVGRGGNMQFPLAYRFQSITRLTTL